MDSVLENTQYLRPLFHKNKLRYGTNMVRDADDI